MRSTPVGDARVKHVAWSVVMYCIGVGGYGRLFAPQNATVLRLVTMRGSARL